MISSLSATYTGMPKISVSEQKLHGTMNHLKSGINVGKLLTSVSTIKCCLMTAVFRNGFFIFMLNITRRKVSWST